MPVASVCCPIGEFGLVGAERLRDRRRSDGLKLELELEGEPFTDEDRPGGERELAGAGPR